MSCPSRRGLFRTLPLISIAALAAAAQDNTHAPSAKALAPYTEKIAGTTLELAMVPVVPKDGSKAFYLAKVETTWDLYDAFVFGFDQPKGDAAKPDAGKTDAPAAAPAKASDGAPATPPPDATTRPSKPYISMDRGYGHAGYPAISVSYLGAKKYCEWLSEKTGKTYRLPTVKEWQAACELGGVKPESLKDVAWFAENSIGRTHAVGTAKPDALGVCDLYGNASEWCTSDEGKGVTLGGTYKDGAEKVGCASIVPYNPEWNASDPQFPKSKWWLADGGFVGFRVVCEP